MVDTTGARATVAYRISAQHDERHVGPGLKGYKNGRSLDRGPS